MVSIKLVEIMILQMGIIIVLMIYSCEQAPPNLQAAPSSDPSFDFSTDAIFIHPSKTCLDVRLPNPSRIRPSQTSTRRELWQFIADIHEVQSVGVGEEIAGCDHHTVKASLELKIYLLLSPYHQPSSLSPEP
jgi:hypothetical protein